LIYEILGDELPETTLLKSQRQKDLSIADVVICVSENTKRDLLKYYEVDENKIHVVHHGYNALEVTANSRLNWKKRVRGKYLLYVGKRGSYKNFITLALAWKNSCFLNRGVSLVCFGGGPFTQEESDEYKKKRVDLNEVIHVSGDDGTLASLYEQAEIFVYPSKYEGFGFPPLEAMSRKCPVVCSNTSCIPEVVGDAGLYFDPGSHEDLGATLEKLFESEPLRKALIEKGSRRLSAFTWKKCALNTVRAYAAK
jgi:glycosyltransferase involved in cell wall biosynthesis